MSYQTPELLLVGAAQNLVLFTSLAKIDCDREPDNLPIDEVQYDSTPLW